MCRPTRQPCTHPLPNCRRCRHASSCNHNTRCHSSRLRCIAQTLLSQAEKRSGQAQCQAAAVVYPLAMNPTGMCRAVWRGLWEAALEGCRKQGCVRLRRRRRWLLGQGCQRFLRPRMQVAARSDHLLEQGHMMFRNQLGQTHVATTTTTTTVLRATASSIIRMWFLSLFAEHCRAQQLGCCAIPIRLIRRHLVLRRVLRAMWCSLPARCFPQVVVVVAEVMAQCHPPQPAHAASAVRDSPRLVLLSACAQLLLVPLLLLLLLLLLRHQEKGRMALWLIVAPQVNHASSHPTCGRQARLLTGKNHHMQPL